MLFKMGETIKEIRKNLTEEQVNQTKVTKYHNL